MEYRLHLPAPDTWPTTVWAIRSATVGTPSILTPLPPAFGISTAFTGGGKYEPDDIRFQSLYRLLFRSCLELARSTARQHPPRPCWP